MITTITHHAARFEYTIAIELWWSPEMGDVAAVTRREQADQHDPVRVDSTIVPPRPMAGVI
jgi:hypothetical protein